MNKSNVTQLIKSGQAALSKHAPEILMAFGITSMFSSVVLAATATPKALKSIDKAKIEKGEELTPVEKVKAGWKPYVPAVATFGFGTCCLVGANSTHTRRNAALAAAYKLSETAYSEYKEKVIETIGEKKERTVRDKIAQDKIENYPINEDEIINTGKGNVLFLDPVSMRPFLSDIEFVRAAVNNVNYKLTTGEDYVSLSEFYDEIGLDHTSISDYIGWNVYRDGKVEVSLPSSKTRTGKPCLLIDYHIEPRYDYQDLH